MYTNKHNYGADHPSIPPLRNVMFNWNVRKQRVADLVRKYRSRIMHVRMPVPMPVPTPAMHAHHAYAHALTPLLSSYTCAYVPHA